MKAKKTKNKKESIQKNLEQTLKLLESPQQDKVYSKVSKLIKQTGYKPANLKESFCEYYTKQTKDGENFVFIRSPYSREEEKYHYGFEKIKPNKLEEFCKKFDNFYKDKLSLPITLKSYLTGMAIGAGAAVAGEKIYHYLGAQTTSWYLTPLEQTVIVGFIGMAVGAFLIGYTCDSIKRKINKEKMSSHGYFMPKLNDRKALELAFGQ